MHNLSKEVGEKTTDIVRRDFDDSSCDEELYTLCAIAEEHMKCHDLNYSTCDKELDEIFASVKANGDHEVLEKSTDKATFDAVKSVETTANDKNRNVRGRKNLTLIKKRRRSPVPSTSNTRNVTEVSKNPAVTLNKTHKGAKLSGKKRLWTSVIDDMFVGISKPSRRRRKQSSTLERINKEGKKLYISTKVDNGTNATHLIKVEIFDLKKLSQVPSSQRWRYATVKAKYYSKGAKNKNLQMAKKMIISMAEEISK